MDWHPSYSTAQKILSGWLGTMVQLGFLLLLLTKVVFIWSKNTAKYNDNTFYYNLKQIQFCHETLDGKG